MGLTQELAATWHDLGSAVLSSILVDHGAFFEIQDVLGRDSLWFPPPQDRVWRTICQCVDAQVLPTVEAVTVRGQFDDGLVQSIANRWTDEDNRRVVYHARELRELGSLADLRKLGRELHGITQPADVLAHIEYAHNRLNALGSLSSGRNGDAKTVSDEAYAQMERFQGKHVKTGFPWLDTIIGGFWPGMNYWITGAYKQGKSTILRNCVLHSLEAGNPVDVYLAEGTRWLFALDCQAMIATRLMCEDGERDHARLKLSGLMLLRVGQSGRGFYTDAEYKALARARDIWEQYPVWVWDSQDAVKDFTTLRYLVKKNAMEHGSLTHWFDHSQKFGIRGTTYEKQAEFTKCISDLATGEMIATVALSQKNEATIHQGETYSAGVKGGGDAAAAADFMFIPEIDANVPGVIGLRIKHSRHTGVGEAKHRINPTSGLILDRWFGPVMTF